MSTSLTQVSLVIEYFIYLLNEVFTNEQELLIKLKLLTMNSPNNLTRSPHDCV